MTDTAVKAEKRRIYADNAATTPVSASVREAMEPYFSERFSNPASLYLPARQAGRAIAEAKKRIAAVLGGAPDCYYFTSGGTEGDNWAVKGTALAAYLKTGKRGHIVCSAIEHHAVLRSVEALERFGFSADYVLPDEDGIVHPEDICAALRDDTCLAAVMLANNEIGTVQPIRAIADAVHARGIPLLCDAVQAIGQIPVDVTALGADFLTLSGHKIHAPKGCGVLYAKDAKSLLPLIDGGGQQYGMRSGTENPAFAVGLAKAVEDAAALAGTEKMLAMRRRLFEGLLKIPGAVQNGTCAEGLRLPGNVNVSYPDLDAESMVLMLDSAGICASGGSACKAQETRPSHVLKAIGKDDRTALSSLRFTLSPELGEQEIDCITEAVASVVSRLRALDGRT